MAKPDGPAPDPSPIPQKPQEASSPQQRRPRRSSQARLMSLLVAFSAVAAAVFAYRHRQTLLAQQQQQPQCPRPNFAVLPHEEPVEALQPAPSPLPSLSPASWGSAISSAMWMLFLKRKPLRYHVTILEVPGGSDKGPDGHRRDSGPLVEAFRRRGWSAAIEFYADHDRAALLRRVAAGSDAYISRVNPGSYANYTESLYFDMCRQLARRGVRPFPHPDVMLTYGSKDSLVKVATTDAGLEDTHAYTSVEALKQQFPATMAHSDRVLKQNRGSTGEGIWVVQPSGWKRKPDTVVDGATKVSVTAMVDNSRQVMNLTAFMDLCCGYLAEPGSQLINQRFLPRITEGEIRVLMIFDRPVQIVHKKPGRKGFSATLFSGARYTHSQPDDPRWQHLMTKWTTVMPEVHKALGGADLPLLWTVDFILDTDADGKDAYRIVRAHLTDLCSAHMQPGEINCSCVGFTTELSMADNIAEAAIDMLTKCGAPMKRYTNPLAALLPPAVM